jgi:hypothetical protein
MCTPTTSTLFTTERCPNASNASTMSATWITENAPDDAAARSIHQARTPAFVSADIVSLS